MWTYLAGCAFGHKPPPRLQAPHSRRTSQCWPSAETHTEVDREASGLPERNWVPPMPRQHEEDSFLLPSPSLSLVFFLPMSLPADSPPHFSLSPSLSLSSLLYSVSSVESMPSGTDIFSGQLAVG